jgi:hypothetical protein
VVVVVALSQAVAAPVDRAAVAPVEMRPSQEQRTQAVEGVDQETAQPLAELADLALS